ncbi:MAG: YnfA family protein [Gallionella sp.]
MELMRVFGLFVITAFFEIVGCYLFYLWFKQGYSTWILLPAALSIIIFVWLLALQPFPAGRIYAAYGGVYVCTAIMWLWLVDSIRPAISDWIGVSVSLLGMVIIILGSRQV